MSGCIYLDHNATTPIDPEVVAAMEPYLREIFGNPSSVEHEHGHAAANAIERAREQVALSIGARPQEIIFTGSCTEANNLAVLGAARANPEKRHIITSAIEHPSVLEPARALEREGWRVTYLGVDELGRVSMSDLESALCPDTLLVSVMGANNEVGTLQPIGEIGALCSERGVLFHTDLAQVSAYREVDVAATNINAASLSAHKAYGPKGIGALYLRSRRPRYKVAPIIFGGGQERGLRPGTLNVAAIVGFGAAMSLARRKRQSDGERLRNLCNAALKQLQERVAGVKLNGHPVERLPNNLSISIDEIEPLALMRRLRGKISLSASSACSTEKIETSHVLLAMYGESSRARQAFRIAPGRFTGQDEMQQALSTIITEVGRLRETAGTAA